MPNNSFERGVSYATAPLTPLNSGVKRSNNHGIVVIVGKDLTEDYVCGALDDLLPWGTNCSYDYSSLYVEIS